jgi:hypothetical protein
MNREYKIMKHSYWDEYGVETRTYYSIRESRKFLGIPYWKDIKHQICGMGDCYNVRTEFKTLEEAEKFINEKLRPRVGVHKWTKIEVKQVS